MGQAEPTGSAFSRFHYPQPDHQGRCAKMIREAATRGVVRCGQDRDGPFHLFYPCLDEVCIRRFWSIESRLMHMDKSHGR